MRKSMELKNAISIMLSTKNLYMKACMQSKELHAMTDEERSRLQEHLRKMYIEIEKYHSSHCFRFIWMGACWNIYVIHNSWQLWSSTTNEAWIGCDGLYW